jgi:Inward rectifier potassium channel C-terminal domain
LPIFAQILLFSFFKFYRYLYTWGQGRITAEGERIPVRVEPLDVDYIDGMLLLPLIIEHTIDERSPLCGHTHTSLVALNAELVVTFEGTTEMGNPFMARRSYIPEEIYWGHQFLNVVVRPEGTSSGHFEVNLDQFHKVERQESLPNVHPLQLSRIVVNRAKRTVPYPLLGENTLVLSDVLCVSPNEDGELVLYCRVGDTYPNQMLEITAKMVLYRWKKDPNSSELKGKAAPEGEAFEQFYLECGYEQGEDRLHLRLPTLLTHTIDADSPLAAWREPGGVEIDSMSEIVVVVRLFSKRKTGVSLLWWRTRIIFKLIFTLIFYVELK